MAPAGFAYAIADQGTEAQKQKYLPMFCGKDYCAASLAVNEPTVGFDPLTPRTVAEPMTPSSKTVGNIGKLSLGVLNRDQYAEQAVICALLRFIHPDLYAAGGESGSQP